MDSDLFLATLFPACAETAQWLWVVNIWNQELPVTIPTIVWFIFSMFTRGMGYWTTARYKMFSKTRGSSLLFGILVASLSGIMRACLGTQCNLQVKDISIWVTLNNILSMYQSLSITYQPFLLLVGHLVVWPARQLSGKNTFDFENLFNFGIWAVWANHPVVIII